MQASHLLEHSSPMRLRSPSSSSDSSEDHDNQTSLSDSEEILSHAQFVEKWEERLGIHKITEEEEDAYLDPILKPYPFVPSPQDEVMFKKIMRNMRQIVDDLEEDELFDKVLLKGSQVGLHQQHTDNIDVIMQSMMLSSPDEIPDGPWKKKT